MASLKLKRIFVALCSGAKRAREKHTERIMVLAELEKELKVAENVLDNLSLQRDANMPVLLKMNSRIEDLKNTIKKLRMT